MRALALALALAVAAGSVTPPQQKRKKRSEEEITQTLELPKELPSVVVADCQRLVFHVSPLSARGLLSQQVRDGLRNLLQQARGATIVRLRGFVAGSGDIRRVQSLVSQTFTERRLPLPALSVARVGALPLDGAQVVLESVAADRKAVNPHGLAFLSAQAASAPEPLAPLAPLAEQALARLHATLAAAGLGSADVLRATCYLSSLDDVLALRIRLAREFPHAALNFVQGRRVLGPSTVLCEAVARLRQPPSAPVRFLNRAEFAPPGGFSAAALVGPCRLAFSGAQLAFGYGEPEARLAFQRLERSLEQAGASLRGAVLCNLYALSSGIAEAAWKTSAEFAPPAPAGTAAVLEGLASLDAGSAIDVIALTGKEGSRP